MEFLQSILSVLSTLFAQALLILIVLVLVDLLLGVLAAWKQKEFKWDRITEFYRTKVIPEMGGWIIFVLAARASLNLVVPSVDDQTYNALFTGGAGIAWALVVRDLLYSVSQNFCTVFGIPLLKPPAT
jgi:UDP-N-acetylmuramyl pentapeptide phosphotransferase/UDP-N-acetylglucosamine-1-phosphate transferase